MPDWPLLGGSSRAAYYPTSGQTVRMFAGAAGSNQKTGWVQLIASIPFDCAGFSLHYWTAGSSSLGNNLIDLGLGAAGSEQVVAPDLALVVSETDRDYHTIVIPLALPAGQRLAVRSQNNNASSVGDGYISITLYAKSIDGPVPFSTMTAYGVVASGSRGTQLNGVFNSAYQGGSWVELSSAVKPARALMVAAAQSAFTGGNWSALVDLGIGASGSEQLLLPGLLFGSQRTTQMFTQQWTGPLPIALPAGQRLVARAGTLDVGSAVWAVVYGFN